MNEITYFVAFRLNPTRLSSYGSARRDCDLREAATIGMSSGGDGVQVREITEAQVDELCASEEPSKTLAAWYGLPYQKYVPETVSEPNVVELIAGEDGGFDQPCRFGNRV